MLVTALAGIVVNLAAAWCISRANRTSLNVEGAFQHILNDLYAFIATAIAGWSCCSPASPGPTRSRRWIVVALMVKAGLRSGPRLRPDLPGGRTPGPRP